MLRIYIILFILAFCSAPGIAQEQDNSQLYQDIVTYYRDKSLIPAPEDAEKAPEEEEASENKSESESENIKKLNTRAKRISALRRKQIAEAEIARLRQLQEEAAQKKLEEKERKVKEAKVQQLLKALGYNDLAEGMVVTEKVQPPL